MFAGNNIRGGPTKSNVSSHLPKGFSVGLFKSSSPPTNPYPVATQNYRAPTKQGWDATAKKSSPPTRDQSLRASRFFGNSTANIQYDSNRSAAAPNYSIYPSAASQGTYIYERSLYSNTDAYTESEAATSEAAFTPSSFISTSFSNDSQSSLQSTAATFTESPIDETFADHTSAVESADARRAFPIHIPALAQALSTIRGNRSQISSSNGATGSSSFNRPSDVNTRTDSDDDTVTGSDNYNRASSRSYSSVPSSRQQPSDGMPRSRRDSVYPQPGSSEYYSNTEDYSSSRELGHSSPPRDTHSSDSYRGRAEPSTTRGSSSDQTSYFAPSHRFPSPPREPGQLYPPPSREFARDEQHHGFSDSNTRGSFDTTETSRTREPRYMPDDHFVPSYPSPPHKTSFDPTPVTRGARDDFESGFYPSPPGQIQGAAREFQSSPSSLEGFDLNGPQRESANVRYNGSEVVSMAPPPHTFQDRAGGLQREASNVRRNGVENGAMAPPPLPFQERSSGPQREAPNARYNGADGGVIAQSSIPFQERLSGPQREPPVVRSGMMAPSSVPFQERLNDAHLHERRVNYSPEGRFAELSIGDNVPPAPRQDLHPPTRDAPYGSSRESYRDSRYFAEGNTQVDQLAQVLDSRLATNYNSSPPNHLQQSPQRDPNERRDATQRYSITASPELTYKTREPPSTGVSQSMRPHFPGEPQRRHSDGDQVVTIPIPQRTTTPGPRRGVRWNENIIAPSPILAHQRRKGWYNRRGDQLWTNDGSYKPPPLGQEYPLDLFCYPEYGEGWMNEDGVRIDMRHRLIPKAPLRPALKRS